MQQLRLLWTFSCIVTKLIIQSVAALDRGNNTELSPIFITLIKP